MTDQKKRNFPRVGVMLTKDAREALKNDPVSAHLQGGMYFNADKVDDHSSQYFLRLSVTSRIEPLVGVPMNISIPRHFVLYMLSADNFEKVLGFRAEAAAATPN